MDISNFLEVIQPSLSNIVDLLLCIAVIALVKLLNKAKEYLVGKVGSTNYNHALEVAKGIYVQLEDEFSTFTKAGEQKRQLMNSKLKEIFPSLTQTELDSINKNVWSTFNNEVNKSGLTKPVTPSKNSQVTKSLPNQGDIKNDNK